MTEVYHAGERELQDSFGTRALADRIATVQLRDHVNAADRKFIEARDMFFLATADGQGRPSCSYKGGDPGFVRVLDDHTLAFPNYDGNGMYRSWGNARVNPHVGLLFIDFDGQRRLRLEGEASVDPGDALLATWHEAQFVVRVHVRVVYPNCPRYIHKHALVERSAFVPRDGVETPVPAWKRAEWARDVTGVSD